MTTIKNHQIEDGGTVGDYLWPFGVVDPGQDGKIYFVVEFKQAASYSAHTLEFCIISQGMEWTNAYASAKLWRFGLDHGCQPARVKRWTGKVVPY